MHELRKIITGVGSAILSYPHAKNTNEPFQNCRIKSSHNSRMLIITYRIICKYSNRNQSLHYGLKKQPAQNLSLYRSTWYNIAGRLPE